MVRRRRGGGGCLPPCRDRVSCSVFEPKDFACRVPVVCSFISLLPLSLCAPPSVFWSAPQVGYVFGKGGNTIADVKSKAGVNITTDVSVRRTVCVGVRLRFVEMVEVILWLVERSPPM